jgi:hypothetical protein
LEQAGQPVVRLELQDLYDLGGQFFIWELATAVAGHVIGIQPFDQPNVESAKVLARQNGSRLTRKAASCPQLDSAEPTAANLNAASSLRPNRATTFRSRPTCRPPRQPTPCCTSCVPGCWNRPGCATTVGYGPRFLHSTGQLHKGDAGNGLFIQFTSEPETDLPIPGHTPVNQPAA